MPFEQEIQFEFAKHAGEVLFPDFRPTVEKAFSSHLFYTGDTLRYLLSDKILRPGQEVC